MKEGPDIALIASLIGDPGRANILLALLGGQAMTARELAGEAGVTHQQVSSHLARLLDGRQLHVEKQGRHRYFRLAGADIAATIEALLGLAAKVGERRVRLGPKDPALRRARVCYDHLAGQRGVELFTRLCDQKLLELDGGAITVSPYGEERFKHFGIDISALRQAKRPICRTCLDWSERRAHLAGALGAKLLDRFQEIGWVRRERGKRILHFTPRGEIEFPQLFA